MYNTRMQLKNDTAENWAKAVNFTPLKGELIVYSDLHKLKIGDGVTNVNLLPFCGEDYVDQKIAELINGEEIQY